MRYKYTSKKNYNRLRLWKCPSAGPNASVTGMRALYWGNGYILKCGQYIYLVDRDTFYRA